MPYRPKLGLLWRVLLRRRDPIAAEGLFFEGTWLAEQGEFADALKAFQHAVRLDPNFGGAWYNIAALTERLEGPGPAALAAWRDYLAHGEADPRQRRDALLRVAAHVKELEGEG